MPHPRPVAGLDPKRPDSGYRASGVQGVGFKEGYFRVWGLWDVTLGSGYEASQRAQGSESEPFDAASLQPRDQTDLNLPKPTFL